MQLTGTLLSKVELVANHPVRDAKLLKKVLTKSYKSVKVVRYDRISRHLLLRVKVGGTCYYAHNQVWMFISRGICIACCRGEGGGSWREAEKEFQSAEEYFTHLPSFLLRWRRDEGI